LAQEVGDLLFTVKHCGKHWKHFCVSLAVIGRKLVYAGNMIVPNGGREAF
jgi:hypothetical protein